MANKQNRVVIQSFPGATTDDTMDHIDPQSVAKLVTHSAKFWNFLDERRTTAKKK